MDDLTFLNRELGSECSTSDAILKAVLPSGKVIHISDIISPFKFLDTCPLLYHAFEYNAQGRLHASIEASSEIAVISLTRYCYTGSYLASEPDGDSISLLQHAETYKIAEDFDVPELQIMAHGNFSCQIEYACSLPKHPNDLLDTVRFIYRNFASDEARRNHNLVDTLLNYCVAVYLYHKLGESVDFLTAVHEVPAFRQDLCRTNITRNFEDDCAAEIIRLPSKPMVQSRNAPTTLASRELPSAMLFDLPPKAAPTDSASIEKASFEFATAFQRGDSTLMARCAASNNRHWVPDRSKHSVSPSALTAALQQLTDVRSRDSDDTERVRACGDALRTYKRARIYETRVPFEDRPFLSEAGLMSGSCINERESASFETDEDSYWEGAFCQTETQTAKVATEGTSHSARRLLFEYGRRNARPAPVLQLSKCTAEVSASAALPLRPRNSESLPDVGNAVDDVSEDEGFAMVYRFGPTETGSPHTRISSPELVPSVSIAQAMADDNVVSDDDWTML